MTSNLPQHLQDPWLSSDQAASYLGISRRALYKRIRRGQIPFYRFGRMLRFRLSDLDRLHEPGLTLTDLEPVTNLKR